MRASILPLVLSPLLALTLAGSAHAEHWLWYKINGGAVAYDEESKFKDEGTKIAAVNTLVYYEQPREASAGMFHFMAERLEFECNTDRYRWAHSAVYDRDGGFVTARADSPWIDLAQQTGSAGFFQLVLCGGVPANPVGQAASIEDLVTAIRAAEPIPVLATTPPAAGAAPIATAPIFPLPATNPAPTSAPTATAAANTPPAAQAAPSSAPASGFDFDALAASLSGDAK